MDFWKKDQERQDRIQPFTRYPEKSDGNVAERILMSPVTGYPVQPRNFDRLSWHIINNHRLENV